LTCSAEVFVISPGTDVAERVQVGPALDEVVGVLHVIDELALAPLLDLEGAGADASRTVARGRDVRGIDRGIAGCKHQQQRRLRPLQPEDHRVRIGSLDCLDVGVPVLARVDAELRLGLGSLAHHVEGELDVLRGEGLAVVPLDVLAEKEHKVSIAVLPRPLLRELAHEGLGALNALELVEEDEVAEARHRREAR